MTPTKEKIKTMVDRIKSFLRERLKIKRISDAITPTKEEGRRNTKAANISSCTPYRRVG